MGPIEAKLRAACAYAPHWRVVIASIATNHEARQVVYGASAWLNGGTASGVSEMLSNNELPDVLTEAICAAEVLGL